MINIAIADAHRLFISGLKNIIEGFSGYTVVFEARGKEDLADKLRGKIKPQIVLLDLNLSLTSSFDTAEWLNRNFPETDVIVLSVSESEESVLQLVKLGIKGYLLKDAGPADLCAALAQVASGNFYYPEFVTRLLINQFNHSKPSAIAQARLNEREIEFLRLAGTELTYKEIAERLCVSARTVDGYRDHLFEKLQVRSRVGLVLYAIKNKLITV